MDIAAWLRELGLERYEQAFRENDVDVDLLSDLTEADLEKLGVASLGHRKILLRAMEALRRPPAELADGGAAIADEAPPAPPPPASRSEAERRQLTVMFVDLVGSTELSARLDPEDMSEVITAYQSCCAEVIGRFEGHVAKYMGDGVLAYFGWPSAHEDEAERAVRAGLALVEAVGELPVPTGGPLAARIGIATGQVVVGDLIGQGAAQEEAVVGESPNLAARLQATAGSGQVVIADVTRRLLGAGFALEHLSARTLKGIGAPVRAFTVTGEWPVESRFDAMSGPSLLPMVGRDQELALLLERWALAKAGEGQGVLLVGEAGIGKSRIGRALLDAVADEPHVRIRYQCSPYHTDSAFWPVIQQLGHAAGFCAGDPPAAKLDRLEALLGQAGAEAGRAAPLIADLLGLDGTARYGKLDLTPQAQRARSLEALVQQLLGLAAKQPVLVVLEDAHWLDPTTLELIEQALDRIAAARVLILLTSRPDRQPELAAHPHVTRLTLNRLGRAGVEAIVARLWRGSPPPHEVTEKIIARTDGVPLFVEELTKAVLETGEASIPASLHDSLMARLDRNLEVKEIAQMAACMGREFSHALLAAVAEQPEPDLTAALDKLAAAELIFRRGTPPDAHYTFKHALVRDTAYHSLLRHRRRQLHERIASVLEERFPLAVENEPELLAYHYSEAGKAEQAVIYWRRAGERASARSANVEAIAYLAKGLDAAKVMPDEERRAEHELHLQMAIAVPYLATRGYSASEVEHAYSRASELCEQLGKRAELFPVFRGLWNCHLVRGEIRIALDLARQVVALAEAQEDPVREALSRRALGSTLFFLGRFHEASEQLAEGIAIDDALGQHPAQQALLSVYGERAGVVCRTYLGWTQWCLGFPDLGLREVEAGLDLARKLAHVHNVAFAMVVVAMVQNCRRDFSEALKWADALIDVSREHGLSQFLAMGMMNRGFALAALDRASEGRDQIRTGLSAWHGIGARLLDTQWLGQLGATYRWGGEPEKALATLDEAMETVGVTGETYYQPELLRLRGEVLGGLGHLPAAEGLLSEAVGLARSQSGRSLELRAATSLARLWAEQGERQKAQDLLEPIYGWFTEGFHTADLTEARALLDQLG